MIHTLHVNRLISVEVIEIERNSHNRIVAGTISSKARSGNGTLTVADHAARTLQPGRPDGTRIVRERNNCGIQVIVDPAAALGSETGIQQQAGAHQVASAIRIPYRVSVRD